MAEEHKKKKRKPRRIIVTRHDDDTYSHEHQHDGGEHNLFAGTSADLDDVKQHMDDHFGGGAAEPAEPAGDAAQPETAAAPQE